MRGNNDVPEKFKKVFAKLPHNIPANENIFCVYARIFAVRQGRIDRRVLVAVRKVKPDAALRQKDRADAENVFVRGYRLLEVITAANMT